MALTGVSNSNTSIILGFVPGGDSRGTMDIVWSCVSALIFCAWTVHDSAISDSESQALGEKVFYAFLMVLAPDIALTIALRDFLGARDVVYECNKHWDVQNGPNRWSMVEGFYACMKGFVLEKSISSDEESSISLDGQNSLSPDVEKLLSPDKEKSSQRLLSSEDVIYLVKRDFITSKPYAHAIDVRSKADRVSTIIACIQVLWLFVQCIARAIDDLPITTLEFGTVGYIAIACAIYALKWHKPQVVAIRIPISLCRGKSVESAIGALDSRGAVRGKDGSREDPAGSLGRMQVYFAWLLCCMVGVGFDLWHCVAWNSFFPTHAEQQLWRVCAVLSSVPYIPLVITLNLEQSSNERRKILHTLRYSFIVLFGLMIIFTRGFLFVEMLIGVRRMPEGVFGAVKWLDVFAHI
ncbi:hypothetical protein OBBRIDRAFT_839717 [Obba rivulosa]|uniref:Uncharacterized protein n=1 Tax=Obba rivulosa TaxID=1052685 RepID=A0A8E2DEZ0_9APHY|nr:hypothetical protein OBBRIDRAFT_839717 [Obba rivulosa]